MKVTLLSLGCKVNQAEMSELESAIKANGHLIVGIDDSPELCIINTCTVTAKADYQSRQLIRRAARAGARVIATGCYAELNSDYISSFEGVEHVVKNNNKANIINLLAGYTVQLTLSNIKPHASRTRYFLKVQDGCNNACSYCLIPKARGSSRSVPLGEVIDKAKLAVDMGYNEIVLTGVHLGQYGIETGTCLSALIARMLGQTSIRRIRLSSLEVTEVSDSLIDLISDNRVCRHLHIPLQSGDDNILALMNRNYKVKDYLNKIEKITSRIDGIGLGTDVIAGFPSEDESEFNVTLKVLTSNPLTYMHIFPFSPRPNTVAAQIKGQVADSVKKQRVTRLRELSGHKIARYRESQIGRTLDVLIEESVSDGQAIGLSGNYLRVLVNGTGISRGDIVNTAIEGCDGRMLLGKPEAFS